MSRHGAREVALKALFVLDFTPEAEVETVLTAAKDNLKEVEELQEFAKVEGLGPQDLAYSKTLVEGVLANKEAIDEALNGVSKEWELTRMNGVDRNLLRIADYEIFHAEEKTPASVAINEVVELAKQYGSDESPAFINGLLGTLVRNNDK